MFQFGFRKTDNKSAGRKDQRTATVLAAACRPAMEGLEERRLYSFTGSAVLPSALEKMAATMPAVGPTARGTSPTRL